MTSDCPCFGVWAWRRNAMPPTHSPMHETPQPPPLQDQRQCGVGAFAKDGYVLDRHDDALRHRVLPRLDMKGNTTKRNLSEGSTFATTGQKYLERVRWLTGLSDQRAGRKAISHRPIAQP